jgi:putative ABC transport system permease protein
MEGLQTIGSALLTLGRVAMAVALSLDERLGLERDRRRRSPLVRTACRDRLRYSLIFGLERIGAVALLLVGMVLFAAWTSARRAGTCRGLL